MITLRLSMHSELDRDVPFGFKIETAIYYGATKLGEGMFFLDGQPSRRDWEDKFRERGWAVVGMISIFHRSWRLCREMLPMTDP